MFTKTWSVNLLILYFNMFISLKLPLNDEKLIYYHFQSVVFTIHYVDFIKTESGKIKFDFTIFNWLNFKISQLISLNQILFLIFDALMLF